MKIIEIWQKNIEQNKGVGVGVRAKVCEYVTVFFFFF